MSKRKDGQARGRYTLEFKLEVVRLVKGGQAVPVTAKILGVPVQTLGNWVRVSEKGPAQRGRRQAGERRADGAGALARGECAPAHGARHSGKSHGVLRKAAAVKYAWIAMHKAQWPVRLACEVLGVSAPAATSSTVDATTPASPVHYRGPHPGCFGPTHPGGSGFAHECRFP